MMYKELLDEAGANKKLENKLDESEEKIKELKSTLKEKNEIFFFTKRKIENFEYVIFSLKQKNSL